MVHLVQQPAFADPASDPARAALADNIPGREMPFPNDPGDASSPANAGAALTIDELERVSRWIAQPPPAGGLVPPTCACAQ
jgi:hypothetical protein